MKIYALIVDRTNIRIFLKRKKEKKKEKRNEWKEGIIFKFICRGEEFGRSKVETMVEFRD